MFDVIVIGGGHAGVEAACAAARRGASVAIVTFRVTDIGRMSCNPSIGGVGKGHLAREVDALGGIMAIAADRAAIHRRMLNASKGAAVRGPRVQADRKRFAAAVRGLVAEHAIPVIEGEVVDLVEAGGICSGVRLADGSQVEAKAIVLTTGTFLGATLFRGDERWEGGRQGDAGAARLGGRLRELGLAQGRLKTGTPPRLDGRMIDWARCLEQPSDREPWRMSAFESGPPLPQLACAVTRTNKRTHDVIRAGLSRSPLFGGDIEGRGPRYCPSIEDKVDRFGDRDGHQVFLEPEGLDDPTVYPNGLSTSLPTDIQLALLRTIEGLERVEITEPGYAVEYEYADPRQLDHRLGHRQLGGFFLAGQVNGTTGYEEAAAQGLLAGANAAAVALGKPPLTLARSNSYLGVLVDDLVLQGASEPYRMLTARAEYRLWLRADNAVTRLADIAEAHELLSAEQLRTITAYRERKLKAEEELGRSAKASDLALTGTVRMNLSQWAQRPDAIVAVRDRVAKDAAGAEALEDAIYAPYLGRLHQEVARRGRDGDVPVPAGLSFESIPGLSTEMIERLNAARPATLDHAARVTGVTPAALAALHFAIVKRAA